MNTEKNAQVRSVIKY